MPPGLIYDKKKPTKRKPITKYFDDGYWTDENDKPIKEAFLGDTVKFHVKMKNKNEDEKNIAARLIDSDTKEGGGNESIEIGNDEKGYHLINYYKIENDNKVVITIKLNEQGKLTQLINSEEDKILELFYACSYSNENVDLPFAHSNYLKVKIRSCVCDCEKPEENFPYSENTFNKIKEISELINFYAKEYSVSPIAVAGSIADEYNIINESNSAMFINWLQDDVVINFMPNFAIEFDVFVGGTSKLNNATKHDLGIGNIKLETAKELYDQYQKEFKAKGWDYKDIVNYIQSNEGTVHLATLVIKRAQEILDTYVSDYCECKKEAVFVTYYKQGDKYVKKFLQAKKQNPNHRIRPGEGCRVSLQREKILNSLI